MTKQAEKNLSIIKASPTYMALMKELQEKEYDYRFVICACIKDEEKYLDEWVSYHLSIGFEHIWLYDNYSSNPVLEFVKNKSWANKVTVIQWEIKEYPQKEAYKNFIDAKHNVEWVAFIDIDEFFDIKTGQNIAELMETYKDVSAVHFNWEIYNANGLVHYDNRPLRERFTKIVRTRDWFNGKTIVRPSCVKTQLVHSSILFSPYMYVDTEFYEKTYTYQNFFNDVCCIAHYFTKSLEEWIEKINRGSVDKDMCRKYMEFFDWNPDMLEHVDDSMLEESMSYLSHDEEAQAIGAINTEENEIEEKPMFIIDGFDFEIRDANGERNIEEEERIKLEAKLAKERTNNVFGQKP